MRHLNVIEIHIRFYCKDIFKTQQRKGKCFNCRLQGLIIIIQTFKAQFSKALNSQASSLKVGAELAQDPLHILVQVILIQMSTVPIVLPQPCFFSLSFPEATGAARLRRRGGRWRKQERISRRWRRGRCPESECGGDCAKYEIVHMKGAHCKWGWRLNPRFAVLFIKLWSSDFLSHLTPVVRRKGLADQLSSWLTLQTHPQHLLPAAVKVFCCSAGIADKVPENKESIPVAIHQGVGRVDSTLLAAVVAMLAEHFQANLQLSRCTLENEKLQWTPASQCRAEVCDLAMSNAWYDTVSDVVESKLHHCQQNSDA